MPEVLIPTPYPSGKARTWKNVFPVPLAPGNDNLREYRYIDQILEAIAMNNRMDSRTPEELQAHLTEDALNQIRDRLAKAGKNEEKRKLVFVDAGMFLFYLREVFANFASAYREHK